MGFSRHAVLARQAVPLRRKKGPLAKSGKSVLIEKTFRKYLGERASILPNVQTPEQSGDALLTWVL